MTAVAPAVRLTDFARCAGCAAKMGASDLARALAPLASATDPRLLVGRETFDDAGIFQLSDELALVQTVDFFAPIVDDPYHFGRVAAANALSDVFAMGGEPLTAMNIVGFPADTLPLEVLSEILRGGQDAVHEAGAVAMHSFEFNPVGGRELFFYYGGHLGSGVGTAAGVKLARPNQQVICLVGDGSFLFGPHALWNMARLELPVITIVYNNHAYGGPHTRTIANAPSGRLVQTGHFVGS